MSKEEKLLRGTARPSVLTPKLDVSPFKDVPKPTHKMSRRIKKIYFETAGTLLENGLLNHITVYMVYMFAYHVGRFMDAQEVIEKEGEFYDMKNKEGIPYMKVKHPASDLCDKHTKNAKMWAVELGLGPASMNKVSRKPREDDDPFADLR